MSNAPSATSAETLLLEGPDAGLFAHSQFSSDVLALVPGRWQFSAWLDAQGRVRALFHLARLGPEKWLVLLRGGSATVMQQDLQRYVFRLEVSLRSGGTWLFSTGPNQLPLHEVREEDGDVMLGCGDHVLVLGAEQRGADAWRPQQLRAGWPWLPDAALGALLAPALSLHRLGAVALDKGCYPGQEIVARVHYRGGNKRRLCRVELSQHVAAGTSMKGPLDAGTLQLLQVIRGDTGTEALAVCPESLLDDPATLSSLAFDGNIHATLQASFPA